MQVDLKAVKPVTSKLFRRKGNLLFPGRRKKLLVTDLTAWRSTYIADFKLTSLTCCTNVLDEFCVPCQSAAMLHSKDV